MAPIISVRDLTKRYHDVVAVDHISFDVHPGEIFGIVGPNGAGKTSAVESIMGLRDCEGEVRVLGVDPRRDRQQLALRVGMQMQEAQLPPRMTSLEILDLFASFYPQTVSSTSLLNTWGLWDKRGSYFETLSGGQKQRLFIALALINQPEVVFLDELTTGLDPQARRQTWDLVTQIREHGTTVLLVTHFMDEAERLCDRVGIIDGGKLIALDTPTTLLTQVSHENGLCFDAQPHLDMSRLRALAAVDRVDDSSDVVRVFGTAADLVSAVVLELEQQRLPLRNFRTIQPSLEDVFLHLTGKDLRD